MSDSTKAVFLSYAREDTDAAKRIADALRAFGVEAWFDQSELRGGDTWDTKIRTQIKTCALFLPIVSQRTEERPEGYFRREWKLAVDRTQDMGSNRAFIVPVVIDETKEAGADVPEEFMRYQWTRLAQGVPTPQFVEQVKKLLEAPRKAAAGIARSTTRDEGVASPAKPNAPWLWPAAVVVLGIGALALWLLLPTRPAATTPTTPPAAPAKPDPAPPAKPAVYNKSIAVLPFENRSDDKANAFFTDGIHEDILTNLAHIAELRVVSRTSVTEYRGTTKKMRQIGEELGVAWILEGSVQRAGNKVRVTGQLINARTDEHVWAQSYDRDLTDLFTIQAELAKEIAGALSATLSPSEKNLLERRPTTNPAAYDLYLKARQINRDGNDTDKELETQVAMLQSATALDPTFAAAWAELASAHAQLRAAYYDVSDSRLAKAREAMEMARKLAPDDPAVIGGTGNFYYYALRDYPSALEQFGRIARQWPNDYKGPFWIGLVRRRQGQWVESLASLRRAALLDPGSPEIARNLVISFRGLRRYDEAIAEQTRRVHLLPESLRESLMLAHLHFQARGSTREVDELLAGPIAERAGAGAAFAREFWAATKGDLATAARLDREFPEVGDPWSNAAVLAAMGDLPGARARVEKLPATLRAQLASEPENASTWAYLGQVESLLGHKDEALAAARKALELLPESRDALIGPYGRWGLVVALAWTGDKEAACAELSRLLAEPWGGALSAYGIHDLKSAPWLFPLKGDPRFEVIVNDPKNNAPLNL